MERQRNKVQEPDDEADPLEDSDNCKDGSLPIHEPSQENLCGNDVLFLPHFEQPRDFHGNSQDYHPTKWWGTVSSPGGISTALSLKKMDFQGPMQQGFSLQSSKGVKAKRRKGEKREIHGSLIVHPTGRKDRHSKVCTARGTRDRRLRLSPTTAIQFYDVQDRLGYDRPSKAIDWLMQEAKSAIEALDGEAKIQQIEMEKGQVLKSELVKTGRHEPLISSFGFPGDQASSGYDFNTEGSIPSTSQMWDNNFDLGRFQKSVTWNCNNAHSGHPGEETVSFTRSLPLHFSAPPVLSPNRMYFQREPLQSSIVNYPSSMSELPGMRYDVHNEFSYFTSEKEDEVNMNPVPSNPFYAATFVHHEG
ncbi:uncharacterized protein [Primulina eburnea]|uniref:uncharacterized protein n=1 Tax=Primulina eburnea TaxID=1245227 RepID=UPI003C6CAA29